MKFALPKLPKISLPKFGLPKAATAEAITQSGIPEVRGMDKVAFTLTRIIILAFPLLFLPVLANPFDLAKNTFLILTTVAAAGLTLFNFARTGKLTISRSPFDIAVILLPLIAILSAWLSTNRVASLSSDPLLYGGAALLFFLVAHFSAKDERFEKLVNTTLLSGQLLAGFVIIQFAAKIISRLGAASLDRVPYLSLGFSPAGSIMSAAVLLAVILPIAIGFKKRFAAAIISAGLVLTVGFLSQSRPILLPAEAGWKIATGTMGTSAQTAILGIAPGNYIDAFSYFKPASLNSTAMWNLKFTAGSNFYFYVLTTLGVAGLAVLAWLSVAVLHQGRKNLFTDEVGTARKGLISSAVISVVLFAVSPAPAVLIVAFFVILGLITAKLGQSRELVVPAGILKFVPFVASFGLFIFLGFNLASFVLADYYFAQSLVAASQNLGTQTYNLQIQAINLNPSNDAYHLSYSQTNLALADSLAGQKDLSDEQKQAVIQLVQQAIREGRVAAALSPNRSGNWENLASIYRSLINFAQGADQWTLSSLNQAIALDPVNPRLRLDLGGLYFAGKDFVSAAQIFNAAVNLKPDLANSHYNLAQALKNLNINAQALEQLQLTASLVCLPGVQTPEGVQSDCDRVKAEIEELGKLVADATTSAQTATPSAAKAGTQPPLATTSAQNKNLPNAKTTPPAKIASPSGEITP